MGIQGTSKMNHLLPFIGHDYYFKLDKPWKDYFLIQLQDVWFYEKYIDQKNGKFCVDYTR